MPHEVYLSVFDIFKLNKMAILSEGCKPDNFESYDQLTFANIQGLHSKWLNVNLSLDQTRLTFLLYVRQTWMTQLILAIFL